LALEALNIEREKVLARMGEIVDPANDRELAKTEEVEFWGLERTLEQLDRKIKDAKEAATDNESNEPRKKFTPVPMVAGEKRTTHNEGPSQGSIGLRFRELRYGNPNAQLPMGGFESSDQFYRAVVGNVQELRYMNIATGLGGHYPPFYRGQASATSLHGSGSASSSSLGRSPFSRSQRKAAISSWTHNCG